MIKTRFAPSPTGSLHVGSIKTALINYLFAKNNNGEFLLRVEDTDKERSTQDYVKSIEDGLEILELYHDGDIFYQSSNLERHKQIAKTLLDNNKAYKCYATVEEIEDFRKNNPGKKFISRWSDPNIKSPELPDLPYVVRLRTNHEGSTVVDDMVQGSVEVSNSELDDMVLLRSDGTPTYMLAVVVDDFDMGITHVIRGSDHFTNTFRQLQIFRAMGWEVPKFMHIPLMHGEDGHKLSKRHGATNLEELIDGGYLKDAIVNYLLLLGIGFEDPEIFDLEHAIKNFNWEKISKSPARFDYDKLKFVNSQHINNLADDEILNYLKNNALNLSDITFVKIKKGISLIKERAELMTEMIPLAKLFDDKHKPMDDKSSKIIESVDGEFAKNLREHLKMLNFENQDLLKKQLKEFAKENEVKFPYIMQVLRASILGTFASPGIIEMVSILGKQESIRRFDSSFKFKVTKIN